MSKTFLQSIARVFLWGLSLAGLSGAGTTHLKAQLSTPPVNAPDTAVAMDRGALSSATTDTGLFISPRPEFPFALQIQSVDDLILVTGLGRMPYSADGAEPITIEFRALGFRSLEAGLRGLIRAVPSEGSHQQEQFIPWVALHDSDNESWDFMFSPQHFLSASRPGAAAKRASNKPVRTGNADIDRLGERLFALTDMAAAAGPEGIDLAFNASRLQSQAQSAASTIQSRLQPLYQQAVGSLTAFATRISSGVSAANGGNNPAGAAPTTRREIDQATFDNYLIIWNAVGAGIALASNPSSTGFDSRGMPIIDDHRGDYGSRLLNITRLIQRSGDNMRTSGSGASPRPGSRSTDSSAPSAGPAPPVISQSSPASANSSPSAGSDPWDGRPLDEVLAGLWSAGFDHSQLVVIHRTAPDADHAWRIESVTVLPDGRIQIVFYGSGPDGDGTDADPSLAGNQRIRPGVRQPNRTGSGGSHVAGGDPGTSTQPDQSGGNGGTNLADVGGSRGGDPNSGSRRPGDPSNPTDVQPPPRMSDPPPPPPRADDLRPRAGDGISRVPLGSRQVMVPNLVGLEIRAAALELKLAELEISLKPVYTPQGAEPNIVISQSPSAGTSAPDGTAVTITYYEKLGENPENTELVGEDSGVSPVDTDPNRMVEVPEIKGRTLAEAVIATRQLGLRGFSVTYPDEGWARLMYQAEPGIIIDQSPKPGTRVPVGTTILYYLIDDKMVMVERPLGSQVAIDDARRRFNEAFGPHARAKGPGSDASSSVSSLTPDQMAAARDALQRHRAPNANDRATDRDSEGFQPGDAALVDPRVVEHSLHPWRIYGFYENDRYARWFSISRSEFRTPAEAIENSRRHFYCPKPQDDESATVTIFRDDASENHRTVHYIRDVHVNADATECHYRELEIYRGFEIEFNESVHGRVEPNLGADARAVFNNARQLIDRRFPPGDRPTKTTGFQPGDAAKIGSGLSADEGIEPNRRVWLRGSDPNRPQRNFLIASLDDPMGSATLKARQEEWNSARSWYENRQRNGQAKYDIRGLQGSEQEGVFDITVSSQLNGDPDYSSFARYEVYRNFFIYYADSTQGQGSSDSQLSQGWSQFAASARQLIDERFPE